MNVQEYYLGLDMGTSSVGWAVADDQYQILRAKGKDLWGVRLFTEAESAAGRRSFRVNRRRLQREKVRIAYVTEYFAPEIAKVDPSFLCRLQESKIHPGDKKTEGNYALFNDKTYTDQQYYQEYPTIFHLRKALIENQKTFDIRLVYLAVINLFHHRGHFLNANIGVDCGFEPLDKIYKALQQKTYDQLELQFPELAEKEKFHDCLTNSMFSKTRKLQELASVLSVNKLKNKKEYEILRLICGGKGKPSVIFDDETMDEDLRKLSISFQDTEYETNVSVLEKFLSPEQMEVWNCMKELHDAAKLEDIMQGYSYLSEARVASYNRHREDLKRLKHVIGSYLPEEYDHFFRMMESGSYSAYIGTVNSRYGKIRRTGKHASQEELYKTIQGYLKKCPQDDADVLYLLQEIETENLFPKQLTRNNGVIPNQVHANELKRILENAKGYLPFLEEKDAESGLTVSERILQLFTFQIPYYVGPLINEKKEETHAWVVRKEYGRVYPWNFDQKIDRMESAEAFIGRMIRHCTYINSENVLPRASLMYQSYSVLNELNNVCIHGERLPAAWKQEAYEKLFKKGKKVTKKAFVQFSAAQGWIKKNDVDAVTGLDLEFGSTLSSWSFFEKICGSELQKADCQKMIEKIIFWNTVYGSDRTILDARIERDYPGHFSKEDKKKILGLKLRDWGKLSKQFLMMEGCLKNDGEKQTLLSALWNSQYNLMELLSDNYATFRETLEEKVTKKERLLQEIEYSDLEEEYLSAPVRRMVWQTLLIMKDLQKVIGKNPRRIFIEMARDTQDQRGNRTTSRKRKFEELYKNCKIDGRNWESEIKGLSEAEFRRKKLYLYYLQQGRCMYTGEPIPFGDLFNDNLYDIDHIYPRHFVKDDSMENNLVLVKKQENGIKSDHYPLSEKIRMARSAWWRTLLNDKGGDHFITREKYNRLIRTTPFTEQELAGFIQRQLVETRQGTKAVASILQQTMPESEVVYVKAGNVSDFRKKRDFLKVRSLNDFHHAQDAYLNIVVGNVYRVKFSKNPMVFVKEYKKNPKQNPYHLDKIFDDTVKRNGEIAWIGSEENKNPGSIVMVRKMMTKNTPLITRMAMEAHGSFSDLTVYSAKTAEKAKGVGYMPMKSADARQSDTTKYGGLTNITGTYFSLISYEEKKKLIRSIEAVPLYVKMKEKHDPSAIRHYFEDTLGYKNVKILLPCIKKYSLLRINGYYAYLTGRTGAQIRLDNAVELCLNKKYADYIYKLDALTSKNLLEESILEKEKITKENNRDLFKQLTEKHLNSIYGKKPNAIGEKLKAKTELFESLPLQQQVFVLQQVIQYSNIGNSGADLSFIQESKSSGITLISKKITNLKAAVLILQSPTGLFQQEIDLLKV